MVKKHIKRCSTSLIIREMQMKTIVRYHLIPVRRAIIKNSTNNKCWRRCVEKRTLLHCWCEGRLIQQLCMFLKKLKLELPYDRAISLLGTYPEKAIITKDTCTPMLITTQLTIARTWEQPKYTSTQEWIKKI